MLVVREFRHGDLAPEIGGEESVCFGDGSKCSLQEVTHGGGRALGLGVAILDTSQLQQTLASGSSDETSSTRSRDETAHNGADLSADF